MGPCWRGGDAGLGAGGSQELGAARDGVAALLLAKADIISTSQRLCFIADPQSCPTGGLAATPALSETLFLGAKSLGVALVLLDLGLGP